jgi:hypothetical protein
MKRLLANFDPADQESLENSVNLGKLDNPGGGNHGILGPHGKRERVLPSPHALVFISVYSVCSVVAFLGLGFGRHPSRIGYAQFVVRIAGHDKQQVAQTV